MESKKIPYWILGAVLGLVISLPFVLYTNTQIKDSSWVCERNAQGWEVAGMSCSGMSNLDTFLIILSGIVLFSSKMKYLSYAKIGGIIAIIFPACLIILDLAFFLLGKNSSGWGGFVTIIMIPIGAILFSIGYFIGKIFDKKQENAPEQSSEERSHWKGILGLIFGFLSIFLCMVSFVGLPLSIIGFIFSTLQNKTLRTKVSVAGKVASIIGFILSLGFLVLFIILSVSHGGWMQF